MRATPRARAVIAPLAAAALLLCGSQAQAAACTTQDQAIDQFKNLVQSATQRVQTENEPDKLHKDKIGLVLVARPAASRTTDQDALRRDINALSQQLGQSPADTCRTVESIRRTHGL
ncbi:hypothetical protein [Pseudorhodoferax sp.]|uniref:hypothetical protein n=1 Tax=Pseudorhodoferax sp. TaxID=1993553 RepID=UPI002DD65DB8|nr:hypothetical protein [Pseudorhodoferax sp.]